MSSQVWLSKIQRYPWLLVVGIAVALTGVWLIAWSNAAPTRLADAGVTTGQIPCLSYAPFRRPGATPFDPSGAVTQAQIEEDLRIIKTMSNCVRTYGVGNGLSAVPNVAERLGMKLRLGVWLAGDPAENEREITLATALSHQYSSTIEYLVVGNEVLLRRELSQEALAKYLRKAKSLSAVPITYADVWEFWQRHAQLAREVDVITIHVLPFWEDHPVAVNDAVSHVYSIYQGVAKQFAPKPVWLGETGWPSKGRQRDGARPGLAEQTQFVRELLTRHSREPLGSALLGFNLIEAFDQPWKQALEGAMGGHWGVFSADGKNKVSLTGPILQDAKEWLGVVRSVMYAVAGTLLAAILTALSRKHFLSVAKQSAFIAWSALSGACIGLQLGFIELWSIQESQQLLGLAALVGLLGASLSLVMPLGEKWKNINVLAILLTAASHALLLIFDGRYLGFAWVFYVPVLFALWFCLAHPSSQGLDDDGVALLSLGLILAALVMMVREGLLNTQALGLGSIWLLTGGLGFLISQQGKPERGGAP